MTPVQSSDAAEQRRHPGDQIDASLDHRRRVQIRADRRGRLHRVRQPEVERELRRLGERREEHQADDRRRTSDGCRRCCRCASNSDRLTRAARLRRAGRPRPAAPGRRRRSRVVPGALRAALPDGSCSNPISRYDVNPVSSQKTKSGEDVVAEHNAQHGSHEGEQRDVEPAGVGVSPRDTGGIQHNQRADAGDQGREQQAQSVEMERQRQPETRRPRNGHREGPVDRDQPECVREVPREHRGKEREELSALSALMPNPPSRRQEEKGRQDGRDVKRLKRHASGPARGASQDRVMSFAVPSAMR